MLLGKTVSRDDVRCARAPLEFGAAVDKPNSLPFEARRMQHARVSSAPEMVHLLLQHRAAVKAQLWPARCPDGARQLQGSSLGQRSTYHRTAPDAVVGCV